MSFTDKVVLVTGASRGIGRAIAEMFAARGAKVVGTATSESGAEAISAYLGEQGCGMALNVTSQESIETVFAAIKARFGDIDILINNAGITRDRMFAKMERDGWDAVIATNLTSLFNMTKQVSAKMAERGWGRIVNISSVNGVKGQAGQTNYSAAKAGVIGFTKALAAELAAKGVTVNAIAPGYVATKMVMAIKPEVLQTIVDSVPMKRLAKPEEIGYACAYLSNDLSGFTTGATININGGLYYQ